MKKYNFFLCAIAMFILCNSTLYGQNDRITFPVEGMVFQRNNGNHNLIISGQVVAGQPINTKYKKKL